MFNVFLIHGQSLVVWLLTIKNQLTIFGGQKISSYFAGWLVINHKG